MKLSQSEFGHEYDTYRFGYCLWATLEAGDSIAAFYESGFLPYSADPKVRGTFYMARSARLDLKNFSLSSENRRIAKRFDGTLARSEALLGDPRVHDLFLEYFRKRHGKQVMSAERLDAILASPLPLRLSTYAKDGEPIAAVLEVVEGNLPAQAGFGHYWFSAYDPALVEQSLGMWLMLDSARRAKEAGLDSYYLGTVYGPKALYKTNFKPLEFWDGSKWNDDLALLKRLARAEIK